MCTMPYEPPVMVLLIKRMFEETDGRAMIDDLSGDRAIGAATVDGLLRMAGGNPLFIEDPVQIDSTQSQGEIARRITSPLANGERMVSIWEFRELLAGSDPRLTLRRLADLFTGRDPAGGNVELTRTTTGAPADIAVDTKRNRVAVPYISLDRVDIWQLPAN